MINFLKLHRAKFMILIIAILMLSQCSVRREVQTLKKTSLETNQKIDSLITVFKEHDETSKTYVDLKILEYLILENDIDKGKRSISDAQLKFNELMQKNNGK